MKRYTSIILIAAVVGIMLVGALAVTTTASSVYAANNGVHNGNGPDPCANSPNPNSHRTTEHNPHCI
jgi:hypothetical protein